MAVLPSKLVERLNNIYELGEYNFGKELQRCLSAISTNPGTGACITIPTYSSTAAAEAACGAIEGVTFLNSSSDAITIYAGGQWVELDWVGKCTQVDSNSSTININTNNITGLLNSLSSIETTLENHNHDGINSPPIDIKDLITTAPFGNYFFSTGSGIDCGPVPTNIVVTEGGAAVNSAVSSIDFSSACFDITSTGANSILVDIPLLPGLKSAVDTNTLSIATNTTAISNLSTVIVNTQTQVTDNATNITNLQTTMASHCHDGVDSAQIRIDKIISQDGPGSNISNNFVVCADGVGGWNYVDKATIAGNSVTVTDVSTGDGLIALTSTATNYDIKGITTGCGIAVTDSGTDLEVAIDFAGMPNVGTALDINQDTILIHDASTNSCVQTSLFSLMDALAPKDYLAGKGLTRTTDAVTGDCTFDLDLTTITAATPTDAIDDANDFIVYYDDSESDCKTLKFDQLPNQSECCLPDPGNLTVLDPVYIDPATGAVTPSDITDPEKVATFVVTGFKPGQVCIQDFGVVTLDAPHGQLVGDCIFEGPNGTGVSVQPTSGINNVLYHTISTTKVSITAGTRPFEISTPTNQSFEGFRVTNSVAQSFPPSSTQTVSYDTVKYDTASGYSTVTSEYTVPTTGYWSIGGWVDLQLTSNVASGMLHIFVNTTPVARVGHYWETILNEDDYSGVHLATEELLNAGDVITMAYRLEDGAANTDSGVSAERSQGFYGHLIAPL